MHQDIALDRRRAAAKPFRSSRKAVLALADLAAVSAAFALSLIATRHLHHVFDREPIDLAAHGLFLHTAIVTALTGGVMVWFRSRGHYRRQEALADQIGAVLSGCALAAIAASAIQFATVEVGSRFLTLSYWALLPGLVIALRFTARTTLQRAGAWSAPATLFIPAARAHELSAFIARRTELGLQVETLAPIDGLETRALIADMRAAAARGSAILYAPDPGDGRQSAVVEALVLEGAPFMMAPRLGPIPRDAEILQFPPEDLTLIAVGDALDRPLGLALKRAFDIVAAGAALILLAPILAAIAVWARVDGGPALFRQARVGKNGELFDCLKFRSMAVDAEARLQRMIATDPEIAEEWSRYQKLRRDPRVTAAGCFIRKFNLDELPQLLNVLRGDMSLVGPRPMIPDQVDAYGPAIKAYKRLRPGITGLWQTNGRNATTFAERARLDAFYARNWSLWRDFVILVRTVRELVSATGR